ncbi:MAG: cation transporter, partial [Patescibacteria group bacterium]
MEIKKLTTLDIEGMHCASCAQIIEHALKKTAGVEQANVNFATEKAIVKFDENAASLSELIKAVEKAGYRAVLADKSNPEAERQKRE